MNSVTFDRAAGYYDRTRGFPPGIGAVVAEAAEELIGPAERVLEIGIGTGRIARPLLERGYAVTGVDLSRRMMEQLMGGLPPGDPRPALAQGDATCLPFAARAFDAVVTVHVFHLIAGWREAVAEARRCLRPGGAFLSGYNWRPADSPGEQLRAQWKRIMAGKGWPTAAPGTFDFDDVQHLLVEMDAASEERKVGHWETTRTVAEHMESIEHRTWSSTWAVPDTLFPESLAELRAWAIARWGSLDREFTTPHAFVWHRFQWRD
jgi:SAM-dependent methyltransferase